MHLVLKGTISVKFAGNEVRCCGFKPCHPTYGLCCNGTTRAGGPNLSCCGSESYNQTTQKCCGPNYDVILTKTTPDHECCGDQLFNQLTQVCCKEDLSIHNRTNGTKCCRGDTEQKSIPYHPKRAICCGGKLSTEYNELESTCCQGMIVPGGLGTCCGNSQYRSFRQL
nr:PREDICTED: galaxin-like [Latimeria chalumnae]|eukprot:XP_006000518.1 PREDICTED: galaxin-like [Latimeria chalumnae]